jgi:hypothetical protein
VERITYLGAKLDVGCNDGNFCNRDDENYADNAKETKDVVIATLVLPHALENEKEFDEDYREGNQACEEGGMGTLCVP